MFRHSTARHWYLIGVREAISVSVRLGSGGSSLDLLGSSGAKVAVAPSSRSAFFSGSLPPCTGCGVVSLGGDLPPNHVDGLESKNPDIFAGISRGRAGRRSLAYLTDTFSTMHMLTLRARVRAENSPYLHMGDVQFPLCSNTKLARCKMWLIREAVQRERTLGRSEAVAIPVNVIPFAPLRVPKARKISGAVNDASTTVPARVRLVQLRVGVRWNDPRQVTPQLRATGRRDHFNDLWHFIPRSGRLLAIGRGQRSSSNAACATVRCHNDGHPWRSFVIAEEPTKRLNN